MRLWIVEPDGSGGMIHYAYQLSSALHRAGVAVTLVTSQHYELASFPHPFTVRPELRLWPSIEEQRPNVFIRKLRRIGRAFRFFVEWHRLVGRAVADRPDVVQFAIIRFPLQGLWLRRLRRRGIGVTQVCHEFELREASGVWNRIHHLLARRLYGVFDHIYFHGPQTRREFLDRFPYPIDRTSLIKHGNESEIMRAGDTPGDLRRHYGIAADKSVVLFFGGLRPSKGLDTLVEAFASVADDQPDAHLLIVGHPTASFDVDELRSHIDARGLEDKTTLDLRYVPLDEVGRVIRTADVVALPYSSGTASGALQVAYAFGRPVVATPVGDVASAVDHGMTGLTVPPNDSDALAAALVKLIADPAETARMGNEALRRADADYSWDGIAAHVETTSKRIS